MSPQTYLPAEKHEKDKARTNLQGICITSVGHNCSKKRPKVARYIVVHFLVILQKIIT